MTDEVFTVLVVDDEPDVVDALRRALASPHIAMVGCTRPLEALDILATRPVDLVISDLDMPQMHGLELLRRVRRQHPDVVRVVLTGRASLESALEAINQGEVHRYLTKPWERETLRRTVDESLDRLAEVRASADAIRKVALRVELREALESRYPGVTRIERHDGAILLDPNRIDASWTLRDAIGASLADTWLLDRADGRARSVDVPESLEGLSGLVLDHRFRLEEPIGSGGFGVVYRGLQLSLERFVAVKVLRTRGTDRAHLQRFRMEALSTCQVVHPNAVTVLDAGVSSQGLAYLVMELLTGETVAQRLHRSGPLSFTEATCMAADLCAALAVAHDSGVLHRDVKPANVFLHEGPEGPVTKLLDFGIAKLASPWTQDATAEDLLVGTPAYIAPERLSKLDADGRVDVYAVGVLLYEALSGSRPFEGKSPTEVARQQLCVNPRSLVEMDDSVPADLDAIVSRMLCKDPAQRPTAAEAAVFLRNLAPHLPVERMRRSQSAVSSVTTEADL